MFLNTLFNHFICCLAVSIHKILVAVPHSYVVAASGEYRLYSPILWSSSQELLLRYRKYLAFTQASSFHPSVISSSASSLCLEIVLQGFYLLLHKIIIKEITNSHVIAEEPSKLYCGPNGPTASIFCGI